MQLRVSLLIPLVLVTSAFPATLSYHIVGDDPEPWPQIFGAFGLNSSAAGISGIFVVRSGEQGKAAEWIPRVESGAFLVLEGESGLAAELGFHPTKKRILVRSVVDIQRPKLPIIWQRSLALPVWELPADARVFTRERWQNAPLVAGFRRGRGGVLWLAVPPGETGRERFPYLVKALSDLGFEPPVRSSRLWAFFDSSYRTRVDLEYFTDRWRNAGISALHVAAWHYQEPDPARDEYLRKLIDACHRRAILVYAWLELPHVSERFWQEHPEWREKTGLLQDAHLDWRKLMNLSSRACFRAASRGVLDLVSRFDWDGVNLAELYFESLEGAANPSRFTPMNDDVRREFQGAHSIDPVELLRPGAPPETLRAFLDFRAELARRMQAEWLNVLETARRAKSHLDVVLTHVDDRFDRNMRDAIGADAERALPLLDRHDFTFLIEDPATVWHLGPQRYTEIASRYRPLTKRQEKLAIDINVVERYQDVYPTRQQTGTELFQLVHLSSRAFPRVALYFENSLLPPDLPLLAAAAAAVTRLEIVGEKLVVDSPRGAGVAWPGSARVNGKLWPFHDGRTLWLPPGAHVIEPSTSAPPMKLIDFNGELRSLSVAGQGIEFAYGSSSRAMAVMDRVAGRVEIDGERARLVTSPTATGHMLMLPRGQHIIHIQP